MHINIQFGDIISWTIENWCVYMFADIHFLKINHQPDDYLSETKLLCIYVCRYPFSQN